MSINKRELYCTFHRFDRITEVDDDGEPTGILKWYHAEAFDDPTDGLGEIEQIVPGNTTETCFVYWSVRV